MTISGYTVVPGFIEPGSCRVKHRQPCFNLVDHTGRIVGQSTDREGIRDLIAAKQMAAILAANCAKVGALEASYARYQVAEDCFNDPDGITSE